MKRRETMNFKILAMSTLFISTASCSSLKDRDYLIARYNKEFKRNVFVSMIERDSQRIIKLLEEISSKLSKGEHSENRNNDQKDRKAV